MSNIDKQALRLAAKNATQGDWKFARSGFNAVVQSPTVLQRGGNALVVVCKLFRSEWRGELKTSQDAAFIAAANPVTVLALLDDLEAAEKRIAELQESHNNLREAMAGIHNTITGGGAYTPLAAILNASKRAYEESAAAAGKGE